MPLRVVFVLALLALAAPAAAQPPARLQKVDKAPVLRVEAGGPTAAVTALAFSPDGQRLYAAGLDKVVRTWDFDQGQYRLGRTSYRVPLGPALNGAVNALALSPDGKWLAVGGMSVYRGQFGFREFGYAIPTEGKMDDEMLEDQGRIYLFDTDDGSARELRGHRGQVFALAFAPKRAGKPPLLASVAVQASGKSEVGIDLRLWNVEEAASLAQQRGLSLDMRKLVRPGLAVEHTGDAPRAVRVAVALNDGAFRAWEPDRERLVPAQSDTATAAFLPEEGSVLTAPRGEHTPSLELWRVSDGKASWVQGARARGNNSTAYATALALVSSRPGGPPDYVAVVARLPRRDDERRLQLFKLTGDDFGAVKADLFLWNDSKQPVLATTAQGEYLAVAGNRDHEILVYRIKDLLDGRAEPQRLRGIGTTFRRVAFASRGETPGIVLSEGVRRPGEPLTAPARGDLVFDIAGRRPTNDLSGWKVAAPAEQGWSASSGRAGGRDTVTVSEDGREIRTIRLPERRVLSDFAVLPPRPPLRVPLLAVASNELGLPVLALYNARSGEQLRDCTGHAGRIFGVAFSADGRLLASVAEDQTVNVWALTDLDQVLGKHGRLPGVVVRAEGGGVVVAHVAPDSPARGNLRSGDVVKGLVEAGKSRPLATPMEFYRAFHRAKPGTEVTLDLGDRGEQTVKASQAIDVRNPLFSLFLTRAAEAKDREWIGWSPFGQYTSSARAADRLLGWHLNTGDPRKPAMFAEAGTYRQTFYREKLLEKLLASATPGDPGKDPSPPPEMGLRIDEDGRGLPRDAEGHYVARGPKVTLMVSINGRPLDTLRPVRWQLDDRPEQGFDPARAVGQDLSAALELERGVHRVVVRVWTKDEEPREYVARLQVRYQPPPPRLRLTTPVPDGRLVVREEQFTVKAEARAGLTGEEVLVTVRHYHQGQELLDLRPRPASGTLTQKVALRPGDNTLVVVAVNRGALRGYEEAERTQSLLVVNYQKKEEAPRVTLKRLVPAGDPAAAQDIPAGAAPLVVTVPEVTIEGEIKADANLTRAEWFQGTAEGKALTGFAREKRNLVITAKVTLQPGEQKLRFAAQTATSDPGEATVSVEYQPTLPLVEGVAVDGSRNRVAGKDPSRVKLTARLTEADNKHPFQMSVLVNGREVEAKVKVAGRDRTAEVPLSFGANLIEVRLSNRWRTSSSRSIEVRYDRVPVVLRWRSPEVSRKPMIDLEAEVDSALPLNREGVQASINGKSILRYEIVAPPSGAASARRSSNTWRIQLKEVVLDKKGANDIKLAVHNGEGRSESSVAVRYDQPAPPEVEILSFTPPEGRTMEPEVAVQFRVLSPTPPLKVSVVREGKDKEVWPRELDVSRMTREGDAYTSAAVLVPLDEGPNRVRVVATNDGGTHEQARLVTRLLPPVALEATSLESMPPGGSQTPVKKNGRLLFEPAGEGLVKVRGKVTWQEVADDERLTRLVIVRVYVNGFQQLPAILEKPKPANPRVRTFEATLLLSRAKDNRVQLLLDGLPEASGDFSRFSVDCTHPERNQRLHLLIVSAEKEDPAGLKKGVLVAIQARQRKDGRLEALPAFQQVYVYDPVVPPLNSADEISGRLDRIRTVIEARGQAEAGNDVVLLYFSGGEVVNDKGHFFPARGAAGDEGVLTCQMLVRRFAVMRGAHVLLFDVDRQGAQAPGGRDAVAGLRGAFHHIAAIRSAWFGNTTRPQELRLLRDLQNAFPRSARLIDMTEQIGLARRQVANLLYEPSIPNTGMEGLRFGGRP